MELRHLELLRELADRGSVAAVAAATHRTPSAVSQQLRTAQRQLGVPLTEPSGRGLRLTEAGAVLARGGTEVLTALERVQAQWDAFRDAPTGRVRLATLPSAGTFLLAATQRRLAATGIELTLSDYDVAETDFADLTADNDIVIGHSVRGPRPAGTEGLTVVPLAREPLDVAMASAHPLASRSILTAHDLVDYDWIGVPPGYPFDTVLAAIERVTGCDLSVRQRLRDNRLIESLVAASDLLAILPRFTTPADAGLVLREVRDVDTGRHVTAIMRPDRAERRAVRMVVEHLQAVGRAVERGGASR